MASRTRRFLFSILLFFVVCGFLGTVVSQRLGAQSSSDESALRDDLRSFTSVYDLVEQNYAEPLTGDKSREGGLRRRHSRYAAGARPALQLL